MIQSESAKKWGILEDGTNQGVKHFADYWEKYPERIPSLEQRLGVNAGDFNNSLEGFENFTKQAERVIDEATVNKITSKYEFMYCKKNYYCNIR